MRSMPNGYSALKACTVSNNRSDCPNIDSATRQTKVPGSALLSSKRLSDRIQQLCAQAISLPESGELDNVIRELREALHEHTSRLRHLAVKRVVLPNRRSLDPRSKDKITGDRQ